MASELREASGVRGAAELEVSPDLAVDADAEAFGKETDDVAVARVLLRRSAVLLVVILVAATVTLALVSAVGKASDALTQVNVGLLLASFAVYALVQSSLIEVWRGLFHAFGDRFSPAGERGAWAVSQLGKYVPTGAMLFVTRVSLGKREGSSARTVLPSIVYEAACTVVAALGVSATAVGHTDASTSVQVAVYALPWVLLLVLHPRIFGPVANALLTRFKREPLVTVVPMRRVLLAVASYVLIFVVAGLGILCLARGLVHVPVRDSWLVIASASIAYVASVLGFLLPAGLGARESGMVLALHPVMNSSIGLAVAVLSRLGQIGVECLMAGGLALLQRREGRRRAPGAAA